MKKPHNLPIKNQQLLTTALTHRSALNEKKGAHISNERLEFLGDAVLELIVSNYLYRLYPDKTEGQLTHLRAKIVQTRTLATAATKLNLGQHLILSTGEKRAQGQKNPSLLANTFEAIIGALYLDQGLAATTKFIKTHLIDQLNDILKQAQITDYKSQLQELWQKTKKITPVYKIITASGPDHSKIFKIKVLAGKKVMGQGTGKSKQAAQQTAAQAALEKNS